MKAIVYTLLLFSWIQTQAQVKTLIPAGEEVDLPLDSTGNICLNTVFNESIFSPHELKKIILHESRKSMDSSRYFIIDSSGSQIEYFILFPCKTFNISSIQDREIHKDGLITYTMLILFQEEEYEIVLKNFQWVKKDRTEVNLSQLFYDYHVSRDVKFKVKNYGILKSTELSIVNTIDYVTMVVQEVINQKSKK